MISDLWWSLYLDDIRLAVVIVLGWCQTCGGHCTWMVSDLWWSLYSDLWWSLYLVSDLWWSLYLDGVRLVVVIVLGWCQTCGGHCTGMISDLWWSLYLDDIRLAVVIVLGWCQTCGGHCTWMVSDLWWSLYSDLWWSLYLVSDLWWSLYLDGVRLVVVIVLGWCQTCGGHCTWMVSDLWWSLYLDDIGTAGRIILLNQDVLQSKSDVISHSQLQTHFPSCTLKPNYTCNYNIN